MDLLRPTAFASSRLWRTIGPLIVGATTSLLAPTPALAQRGDVFSSGGRSPYGGSHPSRRTGKQAIQDDSVYCQQTPDGRVVPKPYGGTRRNIPCGPNFAPRPRQRPSSRQVVFNYYYVNGINTPYELSGGQRGRGNYVWDAALIRGNLLDLGARVSATGVAPKASRVRIRIKSEIDRFTTVPTWNPSGMQPIMTMCTQARKPPSGGRNSMLAAGRWMIDGLCAQANRIDDFRRGSAWGGLAPFDLLECVMQAAETQPLITRAPVPQVVAMIREIFAKERRQPAATRALNFFVVIGHSQGNFFTEAIAKSFELSKEREIFERRLGILALASPSNYVSLPSAWSANRIRHYTRKDDAIVGLLHPAPFARRPFEPNLPALWDWPDDALQRHLSVLAPPLRSPLLDAMGWPVPPGCRPTREPECDPGLYHAFINSHLLENYLVDPPMTLGGRPIPREAALELARKIESRLARGLSPAMRGRLQAQLRARRQSLSPPPGPAVLDRIRAGLRDLKRTMMQEAGVG
ncbi:MAG: hypothetical protein H6934_03970 [Burkholderiaceae bacterium]|nr:hypothetical protein [Burkholderiaceae bacterium]